MRQQILAGCPKTLNTKGELHLRKKSRFLWCSYIKPQPIPLRLAISDCCFLWCSYIKPQQPPYRPRRKIVVSYGVPTSNHNGGGVLDEGRVVVSYGVPTSNHNQSNLRDYCYQLFLMVFLHQTTTRAALVKIVSGCFLWCSYIKPQQFVRYYITVFGCFLWCSYIKPQLCRFVFGLRTCCFLWCSYIKPQLP